jgi:hypothetical protein
MFSGNLGFNWHLPWFLQVHVFFNNEISMIFVIFYLIFSCSCPSLCILGTKVSLVNIIFVTCKLFVCFVCIFLCWIQICYYNCFITHSFGVTEFLKCSLFNFSCSSCYHYVLTLSNPIFLPPVYSPAVVYFGRERGWWITCNYRTVLKEKNRNRKSTTCAICWLKSALH